jgi:acyl-CoA synthetase (AMP-forming)/AMP-acid ligase II
MYPGAFVASTPDKPALIMGGSGFTQTFVELDAAANRLSHVLRDAGLKPGDHVAVCMENHDRYLEVILGWHLRPGTRVHGVLQPLTSIELAYILNDLRAKVFNHVECTRGGTGDRVVAPTSSNVVLRMMLRRRRRRPRALRGRQSRGSRPTPLEEERVAGTDMLYSSGRPDARRA